MLFKFKLDNTFAFNTGTCSGSPADNRAQIENNKADYMQRGDMTEEDWNDGLEIVLDESDRNNLEYIKAVQELKIPELNDESPEDKEQEFDLIPNGKVERKLKFKNGKIQKDKDGNFVYEEIPLGKSKRKTFNKNVHMLKPVSEWEYSPKRKASMDKKQERITSKERAELLKDKLLVGIATEAETDEYKTLKNIS